MPLRLIWPLKYFHAVSVSSVPAIILENVYNANHLSLSRK